jgi:hypothetical protein
MDTDVELDDDHNDVVNDHPDRWSNWNGIQGQGQSQSQGWIRSML